MTKLAITPLTPSRQIAFHQLLVSARKTWLMDALKDALKSAPPPTGAGTGCDSQDFEEAQAALKKCDLRG